MARRGGASVPASLTKQRAERIIAEARQARVEDISYPKLAQQRRASMEAPSLCQVAQAWKHPATVLRAPPRAAVLRGRAWQLESNSRPHETRGGVHAASEKNGRLRAWLAVWDGRLRAWHAGRPGFAHPEPVACAINGGGLSVAPCDHELINVRVFQQR